MKLYHGTGAQHLPGILNEGIKPRGVKAGNWQHTVTSNPSAVYLSTCYAIHFAQSAAKGNRLAVIEVDSLALNPLRFAPDEDFLEQATRDDPTFAEAGTGLKERTLWFRKRALKSFQAYWVTSIEKMGTCCYYGRVVPESFLRVATFPSSSPISFASDPTITAVNYMLMGPYYRNLMRVIFGDPLSDEEVPVYESSLLKLAEMRPELDVEVKVLSAPVSLEQHMRMYA